MPLNFFSKKFFIWLSILEFIGILGIIGYYKYAANNSAMQEMAFVQMRPTKSTPLYGKCTKILPNPVKDSGFVRLEVALKGSDLNLRKFEWNGYDYTSRPGCFTTNADRTVVSMSNFVPRFKGDSTATFSSLIKTTATDNDYEFSIKVFNLKNQLIAKYPDSTETAKGKIQSLAVPVIISDNVKLQN